jgi:hypothetical protein
LRGTEQSTERCEGGRGDPAAAAAAAGAEQEEIASLAERHRVSPAIVREIIRRAGTSERAAVEREIQKGQGEAVSPFTPHHANAQAAPWWLL